MVEKVLKIDRKRNLFWIFLGTILLCSVFYMHFINATVRNIVEREDIEAETSRLTLEIGNKEFQYISKRNNVTLDLAKSMGFGEVSVKNFISRTETVPVAFSR